MLLGTVLFENINRFDNVILHIVYVRHENYRLVHFVISLWKYCSKSSSAVERGEIVYKISLKL